MSATKIIADSRQFANSWVQRADALVTRLGDFSFGGYPGWVPIPTVAPGTATFTADLKALIHGAKLIPSQDIGKITFEPIPRFSDADYPRAPEFDADRYSVPALTARAPAVNFGNAPAPLAGQVPVVPALKDIEVPDAPTLTMPTPIEVGTAVFLPPVPSIDMPPSMTTVDYSFVDVIPDAAFTFNFDEQAYQSAMLDALKAKLINDLVNGGYGIEPGDEAGLWDRAREREGEAASAEMQAVERDFASRGFMMPPGAMFGAMEAIRAKALGVAATLSREVAIKRADLYVENRRFTIEQVRELEQLMLNQHMAAMERVLRAAQVSAQYVMEVFRARVEKSKLKLEAIQTRAQAFRDAIAAEAQKVELYRAQLQAELSKLQIDQSRVDLYRAKLAGVETMANIYRAQVQAAEAAINAERSKVETYKAEVDGFMATVKAKESEFSGYEARIRGETSKVQLFSEQVRAHASAVDAKRAEADIKNLEVKAYAESANIAIRKFELELRAAAEKNGMLLNADEAKLRAFNAMVDGLKAQIAGATSYAQVGTNEEVQRISARLDAARLGVEAARININANLETSKFRLSATEAAVGVYKDMVVGALGSLNSIASLSE